DPGNKDWSNDYVHALILRAAARLGAGKIAAARADLALAQSFIDAAAGAQAQDRYVRRDALDALILRMRLALQAADRDAVRTVAGSMQALQAKVPKPYSPDEIGRYGTSQVEAGLGALFANNQAEADAHFSAAREILAPAAASSRYWRVLDPWSR